MLISSLKSHTFYAKEPRKASESQIPYHCSKTFKKLPFKNTTFLIVDISINFKIYSLNKLNLNSTYLHLKVNSSSKPMAIYFGFLLLRILLKKPHLFL